MADIRKEAEQTIKDANPFSNSGETHASRVLLLDKAYRYQRVAFRLYAEAIYREKNEIINFDLKCRIKSNEYHAKAAKIYKQATEI